MFVAVLACERSQDVLSKTKRIGRDLMRFAPLSTSYGTGMACESGCVTQGRGVNGPSASRRHQLPVCSRSALSVKL